MLPYAQPTQVPFSPLPPYIAQLALYGNRNPSSATMSIQYYYNEILKQRLEELTTKKEDGEKKIKLLVDELSSIYRQLFQQDNFSKEPRLSWNEETSFHQIVLYHFWYMSKKILVEKTRKEYCECSSGNVNFYIYNMKESLENLCAILPFLSSECVLPFKSYSKWNTEDETFKDTIVRLRYTIRALYFLDWVYRYSFSAHQYCGYWWKKMSNDLLEYSNLRDESNPDAFNVGALLYVSLFSNLQVTKKRTYRDLLESFKTLTLDFINQGLGYETDQSFGRMIPPLPYEKPVMINITKPL